MRALDMLGSCSLGAVIEDLSIGSRVQGSDGRLGRITFIEADRGRVEVAWDDRNTSIMAPDSLVSIGHCVGAVFSRKNFPEVKPGKDSKGMWGPWGRGHGQGKKHATHIGADGALIDKASVQKFQGGVMALPADRQEPEFKAMAKAINTQVDAFGKFGPTTKAAVKKFNKLYMAYSDIPQDGESLTGSTLARLEAPDLKRSKAEQDAMVAAMDKDSTRATEAVADAMTQIEVKAAAVTTQAVATQAVAAAPPAVKAEAVAAQTQVTQAQAKVAAAATPEAVATAKEEVKTATENVAKVVDKIKEVVDKIKDAGGEGSFFDWMKKNTIISAVPNGAVVCGALGLAGIAYWYFARKATSIATAVTVAG